MKKLILLFFILFLISCENEAPYIKNPIFNVIIYQPGGTAGRSLTAFLSMHFVLYDENGIEDITHIDIIHTETEFVWKLQREQLETTTYGDNLCHGYSFIEYDNGNSVLMGNYLVRVYDTAGNRSDMMINVDLEGETGQIYKPEIPEFEVKIKEDKKELEILGSSFSSVEIKVNNKPDLFNNSRKKFYPSERLILSDEELPDNSVISVRVNSEKDERLVYFLRNITVR